MPATTLYEYYTQKGQALPPITERGKLFESLGLGSAGAYTGSYQQNVNLLSKLQGQAPTTPITPTAPITPTTPVTPTPSIDVEANKAAILAKMQSIAGQIAEKQALLTEIEKAGYAPSERVGFAPLTGGVLPRTGGYEAKESYKQMLLDTMNEQKKILADYQTKLGEEPTPIELYKSYREELGLPAKEEALTGIQGQVAKTEELLTTLESDINARIAGKGVTEPLRRRLYATEETPLRKQLSDLIKSQGTIETSLTTSRQQLSDLLGMAEKGYERIATAAETPITMSKDLANVLAGLTEREETIAGAAAEEAAKPVKLTEAEKQASAVKDMATAIYKVIGTDGKVSPADWQKAKNAWISEGFLPEDFIKYFYTFINPADPQDYGKRETDYLQGKTTSESPLETLIRLGIISSPTQ